VNDDDGRERLDDLATVLLGSYVLIGRVLALLPIPISLPSMLSEDFDGDVALEGIEQAEARIGDLLLEPLTVSKIRTLLLEWVTAQELLIATHFTLMRLENLAKAVEMKLDPGD
jgi:hypothetical protein